MIRRRATRGLALLLAAGLAAWPASGLATSLAPGSATDAGRAEPARAPTPAPPDELGRGTPRGTVGALFRLTSKLDYQRAASLLDLRHLSPGEAAEQGPKLARQLRVVLDNTVIDMDALSDTPEGQPEPGILPNREIVGRVEAETGRVSIVLERMPRDDGVLIWKFSSATVARVPELYRQFTFGVVGEWLPPRLVETRVLGIALWQWLGLALLMAVSVLLAVLLVRPALPLTRWVFARLELNQSILRQTTPPVRLVVALAVFRLGQSLLALPISHRPALAAVQKMVLIVAVAWLVFRLAEAAGAVARLALLRRNEPHSLPVVELGQRAIKLTAAVFAVLMLLEAVGVQVSALVAAIGVGGIGLALAAQRTVENLFGGLAVIGDQPVRVGDFCRFGDRMGTVERIGLWSTRVRTTERSVVSVPNAQFVAMQIENLAQRDRILFERTVPLRYETTPDQVRWLLVKLRELLYAHPRIDPAPARVRFAGFRAGSLDVEIFAYVLTSDVEEFLAVREDLSLRILDIVAASGTSFALPSERHYTGPGGLDEERARAAAVDVERWRDEGRLPIPEFPPERVRALQATLDYPPAGSSQGEDGKERSRS